MVVGDHHKIERENKHMKTYYESVRYWSNYYACGHKHPTKEEAIKCGEKRHGVVSIKKFFVPETNSERNDIEIQMKDRWKEIPLLLREVELLPLYQQAKTKVGGFLSLPKYTAEEKVVMDKYSELWNEKQLMVDEMAEYGNYDAKRERERRIKEAMKHSDEHSDKIEWLMEQTHK